MILYVGMRTPAGVLVNVVDGAIHKNLPDCRDVMNHSPNGFEWGYGGSGPAQLALAMCVHALDGDVLRAQKIYQLFKSRCVEGFADQGWRMSQREVLAVIHEIEHEGDDPDERVCA